MADLHPYLRELPAVDRLLKEPALGELLERLPRKLVLAAVQETLQRYREKIIAGGEGGSFTAVSDLSPEKLAREAAALARKQALPHLRPVVNATGIVLHTNLGRAPLARAAAEAVASIMEGYCNLELDLEEGVRGSRQAHVEGLLCELTGAEAAVVVNNNAAAVFLLLNSCAAGKEVIVSRGTGGDRRLLSPSRGHGRRRHPPRGGGHHQQDLPVRLRGGHHPRHGRPAQSSYQQLPAGRLYRLR